MGVGAGTAARGSPWSADDDDGEALSSASAIGDQTFAKKLAVVIDRLAGVDARLGLHELAGIRSDMAYRGGPAFQNPFGSPASLRTPLAEWRETIFPSTGNVVLVIGLYQIS